MVLTVLNAILAVLIAILILVWYYGHSFKVEIEINAQATDLDRARKFNALFAELEIINKSLAQVAQNNRSLETQVAKFDAHVKSANSISNSIKQ